MSQLNNDKTTNKDSYIDEHMKNPLVTFIDILEINSISTMGY